MKWLMGIVKLLPAAIGTVQSILPLAKEVVVDAVRLIAALPFLWSVADPIINKVNSVYNTIFGTVERIKNWILAIGG